MQSSVTLVGNLVSDVTMRGTGRGEVATFRVAATNSWRDRDGNWVERTTYLNVAAWRDLGQNVAGSLAKGQPVIVVGRPREYEYEKDGVTHRRVEIDADLVGHDLTRGRASFARTRRGPQTSDLAREVAAVPSVDIPDTIPSGWAVPGLGQDPGAPREPAA
jgi:single-strand DNA-binding protein